jgi:hypothetical protein
VGIRWPASGLSAVADAHWLASDVRGQLTRERRHGNEQLTTHRSYNATTGRLQSIRTGQESGTTIIKPDPPSRPASTPRATCATTCGWKSASRTTG